MKKNLKKIQRSIKETLNQEVGLTHWVVLFGLPIFIYIAAHMYARAMSTQTTPNLPVHTKVVYYDGTFSQDIAIEELDTSVYVINETNESLKIKSYEYLKNTNQNTVSQITVAAQAHVLVTTQKPSLVLLSNSTGKQSLIVVGKNRLGDEERAAIIKSSILSTINSNDPKSLAYANLQLSKLREMDESTNAICSSIYQEITSTARTLFSNQNIYIQNEREICGLQTTGSLQPSAQTKSTTSLGSFLKNSVVQKNSMVEFTLPDGY